MYQKSVFAHKCDLKELSNSRLPKIPPSSGHVMKQWRNFKKLFLVTRHYFGTNMMFRSEATLSSERKRQIKYYHWYIIHPFSIISLIMEITLSISWLLADILEPFVQGFYHMQERRYSVLYTILKSLDLIQSLTIPLIFLHGYVVEETSEVVLCAKSISLRYACTFLIFDVFPCVSSPTVNFPKASLAQFVLCLLRLTRIMRTYTLKKFSRSITYYLKISDTGHQLFFMFLFGVLLLHWSTCVLYLVPRMHLERYGNYTPAAWVVTANITESEIYWKYLVTIHICTMHFFSSGTGFVKIMDDGDILVCCTITMIGFAYMCTVTAYILQLISSAGASASKYEELLFSLSVYFEQKKLPLSLKQRMILYYEHRYEHK